VRYNKFDDCVFLGEASGKFGMGILIVAVGAHRHEVSDLVLTPRGVMDARTLRRIFGAGVEPTAVDGHDRQTGDDLCFGRRLLVLEILNPPIPILSHLLAHFVGDPSGLPAADVDFSLISEGFHGGGERSASGSGADDLTNDRRREAV